MDSSRVLRAKPLATGSTSMLLTDSSEVYAIAYKMPWLYHYSRECAADAAAYWQEGEVERWLLGELMERNPRAIACHCSGRRSFC